MSLRHPVTARCSKAGTSVSIFVFNDVNVAVCAFASVSVSISVTVSVSVTVTVFVSVFVSLPFCLYPHKLSVSPVHTHMHTHSIYIHTRTPAHSAKHTRQQWGAFSLFFSHTLSIYTLCSEEPMRGRNPPVRDPFTHTLCTYTLWAPTDSEYLYTWVPTHSEYLHTLQRGACKREKFPFERPSLTHSLHLRPLCTYTLRVPAHSVARSLWEGELPLRDPLTHTHCTYALSYRLCTYRLWVPTCSVARSLFSLTHTHSVPTYSLPIYTYTSADCAAN